MKNHPKLKSLAVLLLMTTLAMLVQGYHPGLEDDAFYLAAIKRDLNPALFPHDADFFRLQFQATVFDKLIAASIHLTRIPLEWAIFLWQFASIFLILGACYQIARRCFLESHAQWAAVAAVAAVLAIPVAGTAISLTDQYLHPRALATAAIVGAIVAVLKRRPAMAAIFLVLAFALHAIMAAFGVSYCLFLAARRSESVRLPRAIAAATLFPLSWIFEPASPAWRAAASTRSFYFLRSWHWYEWLGVVGPLLIVWAMAGLARRRSLPTLYYLSARLLYFAIFQLAVALAIMLPSQFERLRPFEPMRYLQLVYLLMFLFAGGLIGQFFLRKRVFLWLALFLPLGLGMFYAQRQMYPASPHLELPGVHSTNPWLATFAWIRSNTPVNSYFALDPDYMKLPGEDFHGFRALAERSVLSDYTKDAGMAARVPELAPRWQKEVAAEAGWQHFKVSDFHRLKEEFGVNWVVLAAPSPAGMDCPHREQGLSVCRVE
ncbi:MAG TPA: hypothetical protein VFI95_07765 [Terriglobales bacterium]|nr:hypothetical protein [Terriglobales bacterium]